MKVLKYVYFTLILIGISSCNNFEELDFKSFQGVKMDKFENGEIFATINFEVENPNRFNLTIKPSELDVYAEDTYMGKLYLLKKVKLLKKSSSVYAAPLKLKIESGQFLKLAGLAMKPSVNIKIKGKIKGAVGILSKKFDVEESKEIKGSDLKLGNLLGR